MAAPQSIQAELRIVVAGNVAAFLVVEAVLAALALVPSLLSLLALAGLSLLAAALFAADVLRWVRRGTRCIELNGDSLVLYAGPGLAARRIPRSEVSRAWCRKRLGRRTAVVELRAGRPARIHGDAFPPADFSRFCAALAAWARPAVSSPAPR